MTDPACTELKKYTYAEHRFRFAAWAAGSALRGKQNNDARKILKRVGFFGLAKKGVKWLPDPQKFDKKHHAWCKKVRKEAKRIEIKDWSYGHSAKLINVFIKTLAPLNLDNLPEKEANKWLAVHPPIDREVLKGMNDSKRGKKRFGKRYEKDWITLPGTKGRPSGIPAWQKFKYEDYEKIICMIRENLRACGEECPLPLWKNERFFKP